MIAAGIGNDIVRGRGGQDVIDLGAGNDVGSGGTGDDSIDGGQGFDRIFGDSGNDDLDGVAVQWYRTIDDFAAFISEPAYAELIAPDERRFLDVGRIEFIITEEPHVVIDGARPDGSSGTAPA